MGVVSVDIRDIAPAQDVKLALATAASGIDWEQNRPCYAAADETEDDENLEEAQEEVAIEGVVLEDEVIWKALKIDEISKEAFVAGRRAVSPARWSVASKHMRHNTARTLHIEWPPAIEAGRPLHISFSERGRRQ